ncbi:TrmH family RNA methyltransferase [Adhaeribacter aquaticus]|uniref:TrmH family RNA methyltransferase n=1 Tax=Adhaeribacter aquaticus TaxID=299567 RepID=UPI00042586F1|nr:RNA methyltransferase [Adhaeribacter aquaticus]
MLSKAILKYINSLQIKKYRTIHQAFLVEGAKSVRELLQSDYKIERLFITEDFYQHNPSISKAGYPYEITTEKELEKAGTFASNNAALAIARIKPAAAFDPSATPFTIALDEVRDPGNLGTIIRIADWYGINHIVCSQSCADFYNPKVISATMGSFSRITVSYVNLVQFLNERKHTSDIYGAALEGENLHKLNLEPKGVLVMGSESHGLTPEVRQLVNKLIKIPGFGKAESLNVAAATGIITDNFFRNL